MNPAPTLTSEDAEAAILRAADDLFYSHGIATVRMADIRDRAGISMRRLYRLYPSKADLIRGWLAQRHEAWMGALRDGVTQRIEAGDDTVDALFGEVEDWLVNTDYRGCGFINTHAERSDLTDDHRVIIRLHKQELDSYLRELLPDVPGLAVLVDGAIVQASIFTTTEPVHAARRAALALVQGKTL